MLEFRLSVRNAKDVAFRIERFGVELQDWREAWPNVSARLALMLAGQFEREGERGGHGRWAPLSAAYAKRKAKKYPGKLILQASGGMRASLAERSLGALEIREPLRMRFGTGLPYAVYHQTGTRKMPARRIFDLNDEDRFVIRQAIRLAALKFSRPSGIGIGSGLGLEDESATLARQSGRATLAEIGVSLGEGI